MKLIVPIIVCALVGFAMGHAAVSAASRDMTVKTDGTQVTTFASSSDEASGEAADKAEKPLTWKDRAKDSSERSGMRWWSLFGLLLTGGLGVLLWKESEKRGTRLDIMIRYGVALVVFADCLLFFNILRWLFPGMIVIVMSTALCYLNRSRKLMIFLHIVLGLLLTWLCFSYDAIMWRWAIVGGIICWLVNMFMFMSIAYMDITRICPHCHYFADHQKIDTKFDGEDISTDSFSSTQYGDARTVSGLLGDYKTRSTTTTTQSYTYLNKHYTDTYECMKCGKPFTHKRTESEEIDSDYKTTNGSQRVLFG